MLALRGSSDEVIVTDEHLNGTDMIDEFLGKQQRLTPQTGHTLVQCVIETLDVLRFAGQLDDRFVLRRAPSNQL